MPFGAAHEVADDMLSLGRTPVLDIEHHRGSSIGADLTKCATVHVGDCDRWGISFGRRDTGAFIESRVDKTCSSGCRSDLAGPRGQAP